MCEWGEGRDLSPLEFTSALPVAAHLPWGESMLSIRYAQQRRLAEVAGERFEDRVVAHLGRFFRRECDALGEEGTRERVRYGTERARSHGFVAERHVVKYIDLMFAYGRDFDADLPWAKRILHDEAYPLPSERIDALYDEAMSHAR
jgi:hypothetical protein